MATMAEVVPQSEQTPKRMYSKLPNEIYMSDLIKVSEFQSNWLKGILKKPGNPDPSENKSILQCPVAKFPELLMDLPPIPSDLEKELAVVCSIDALQCEGEPPMYEYYDNTVLSANPLENLPKDIDLATLRFQKQELIKRWKSMPYRRAVQNKRRDVMIDPLLIKELSTGIRSNTSKMSVNAGEVVLTVLVCYPSRGYCKKDLKRGGVTFMVLGNQLLTELRDKINCVADNMIPGNYIFNHNADMEIEPKAKDLYKSGFFFINNTFYNDMRDPLNRDYSNVIITWATSEPRGMGPYQTKTMEETRFKDLEIQLGYPYLYRHQGHCEHLLLFTDIRLINGKDCRNPLLYPLCCGAKNRKRIICMSCHSRTSKWVVEKNKRLPTDPFFFCQQCFSEYNYDANLKPIGDFIAHPYCDLVSII